MQKKIPAMLLVSLFLMNSVSANENVTENKSNLHIVQEQDVGKKIDEAKQPVKKLFNNDEKKSDIDVTKKEIEDVPPSFKIKENFTPDTKSVKAFSEIDKLESVISQKGVAWYNPRPNDKDFSIVFHILTDNDSETLIKKTDDEDDLDYKNYRFVVMSVYYKNKKQGDQLTILLPSKYENAIRLEKFGSKEDSINADLLVDDKGRLVSILGPSEAVFLKKKQFTPIVPNPEKAPNMIFY